MQEKLEKNKEKWIEQYDAVDITIGLKEIDNKLTKKLCYKLWVKDKVSAEKLLEDKLIPRQLEMITTDVKKEEEFEAYQEGTKKLRPIKMGGSIGNGGTGTSGFLYKKAGEYFILTNAHVCASDPFKYIKDQKVTNYQPGKYHQPESVDTYCGDMRYMILLNQQGSTNEVTGMSEDGTFIQASYNTADAGLIELKVDAIKDIIDIPNAPRKKECIAKPGDTVIFSSWRMGGVTEGIITDVGKSSLVSYDGKKALLRDLIVVTKMGDPGTSGSGAMRKEDMAVFGLNFAGSSSLTLLCAIQHINNAFGGEVVIFEGEPTPPEPPEPPKLKKYRVDLRFLNFPITGIVEEI